MNKNLFSANLFVILLLISSFVSAADWTPPTNIQGRNTYTIYDFINITANSFCLNNSNPVCITGEWPTGGEIADSSIGADKINSSQSFTFNGVTSTGDINLSNAAINQANWIQFNTSFVNGISEGRMQWNSDYGLPEIGLPGGSVTLQMGGEFVKRVTNDQGSTIFNGQLVYISGGSGINPYVKLADKSSIMTSGVFGMATENILDGQKGYITIMGDVHGVDTSGCSFGQVLWLSDDGNWTTTRPTAPDISTIVAQCGFSNSVEGTVTVIIQTVPRLVGLSDVEISSPSDNQIIYWDAGNSRWEQTSNPTFNSLFIASPPVECNINNSFMTQFEGNRSVCRELNQSIIKTSTLDNDANFISTNDAATLLSLNTGHGDNELYAMNQPVRSSDAVTYLNMTIGSSGAVGGNSTCIIIYSPDGGTTLEVCN